MRVHFFTKSNAVAGSSRLRAFLVAEYLERLGMKTALHSVNDLHARRKKWEKPLLLIDYWRILASIKKGDIIFLQRTIYSRVFIAIILTFRFVARRKMVFDFDDAIYLPTEYGSPSRTRLLTKQADAVIVAFHNSLEWAKQYNDHVYFIPTSIPLETYEKRRKRYPGSGTPRVIGWIGNGIDQFVNLRLLAPAFSELARRNVPFTFRIIGAMGHKPLYAYFRDLLGDRVEFIDNLPWTDIDAVTAEIEKFDVSVVPLELSEWNRGKYSLKGLESMVIGIPTIITATEGAQNLIEDGVNGYLATTNEDWVRALTRAMTLDEQAYAAMAAASRKSVEDGYSLEANVPKIRDIILSL